MKRTALAAFLVVTILLTMPLAAAAALNVIANDGTFLGTISCDSIGNPYSPYGNKFSSSSIWNKFGQYGNPYSPQSPFNQFTPTPPAIYNDEGDKVGYLTLNKYLPGQNVSPMSLEAILMDQCNQSNPYRD